MEWNLGPHGNIGVLPPSSINAAPIMRGLRIREKTTDTRAKALFSKFRLLVMSTGIHISIYACLLQYVR